MQSSSSSAIQQPFSQRPPTTSRFTSAAVPLAPSPFVQSPFAGSPQVQDKLSALFMSFLDDSKDIQEQFPQVLPVVSTMPSQAVFFRYAVLMERMKLLEMNELCEQQLHDPKKPNSEKKEIREMQDLIRQNIQQLFQSIAEESLKRLQEYDKVLPPYFQDKAVIDQNAIPQILYISNLQDHEELVLYDTLRTIQQMRLETVPTQSSQTDVSQLSAKYQEFYRICEAVVSAFPEMLPVVAYKPIKALNFRYHLLELQHSALSIHTTCCTILRSQSCTAQEKELAREIKARFPLVMDDVVKRIYAICVQALSQQDAQLAPFATQQGTDPNIIMQFLFKTVIRNRAESFTFDVLQSLLHTQNIQLL